jgi:hypothetical protein
MRIGDRVHLNGYPNKGGIISKKIKDKLFGGNGYEVHWDDGDTTRNNERTLCQCKNGECASSPE